MTQQAGSESQASQGSPRAREVLDGLPAYVAGKPASGSAGGLLFKLFRNQKPQPPPPGGGGRPHRGGGRTGGGAVFKAAKKRDPVPAAAGRGRRRHQGRGSDEPVPGHGQRRPA